MAVLLVYATFILFIIVLLIITIYFMRELITKKYRDKKISIQAKEIEKIFNRHLKNDDLKKIKKEEIEKLQELVLTKKGLEAFNICYNNYLLKHGTSEKSKNYIDLIIDYKIIHENNIVKERYKDSYILYLLSAYQITTKEALDYAMESLEHTSLYARNNALRVIENSSNEEDIIKALKIVNNTKYYYNNKILIDFITEFKGDKIKLTNALISKLESFNDRLQKIIIEYFTNTKDINAKDKVLEILNSDKSLEITLAAIKYFGKVITKEAYKKILEGLDDKNWEIRAVCGKVIEKYGNDEVVEKLIEKLTDSNWFVRYNCAFSLINLNNGNEKEVILQTDDNYAKEIYIYALFTKDIITITEYKKLKNKISKTIRVEEVKVKVGVV